MHICLCSFTLESPKMHFKGQVVWVVGASSGIGASLAKDFVKAGARVIISARRVDNLKTIAEECSKLGEKPLVLPFDLTDFSKHSEVYQEVIKVYGKVDILFLNSGIAQLAEALETPLQTTENIMNLNYTSYVALNKVVMPDMIKRKDGKVVVLGSISGIIPTPMGSSYSASKFALQGYFGALRGEISGDKVRVTIVNPGPVVSEIMEKAYIDEKASPSELANIMDTSRCTSLILKGLYYNFDDLWITKQPFLFLTGVAQHFPSINRWLLTKVVGPSQVKALRSGGDAFSMKGLFGFE